MMMNNRNESQEPQDQYSEKSQSDFSIRQANSIMEGSSNEEQNASRRNLGLKINGTSQSLDEGVSPNISSRGSKDKYENMDGEKILRYIKAKLKTNPFQRWQIRNNKFPIKFLLHIVLIIFVTMQVKMMAKQEIDYTRFNIDFWKSTILKIDPDDEDNKVSKFFFTPKDLQANLQETLSFFQDIQTQTQFDVVNYDETKFFILSYYTIWPTDKTHRLAYVNEIDLEKGILQPFVLEDIVSLKEYTQKINMFSFIVSNLQTKFSVNSNICWDIKIQYIIESGFKVEASVDADQVMCQKSASPPESNENNSDTLRVLKDKFNNVVFQSKHRDEDKKELKKEINNLSIKARKEKRRILAEALSDYHVSEEWRNFQSRKGQSFLTKPVKRRGYQRIPSPFKQDGKQNYRPARILVPLKNKLQKQSQSTTRSNHGFQTLYINLMVVIISSILFFLHMRYVYRIFVLYECAKQATDRAYLQNIRLKQSTKNNRMIQSNQQGGSLDLDKGLQTRKIRNILDDKVSLKWENITLSEKLKFFNKWQLLSMVGNFFQICGSILLFVSFYTLDKNAEDDRFSFIFNLKERLIGFGCAIAWITVVQYVEYDREHIIFSNLMSKVIKQWLYTLIGITPVFMAYSMIGYAFYNESIFFHSMSYTMTTLFATYHGDQISSFMDSINESKTPFHQFYMLTFTMLFAMAVYNFFTSTIGLAWDEIKEKKKNKLLKQQLKQNYLIEEELFKAKEEISTNNKLIAFTTSGNEQKMSTDQMSDYRGSMFVSIQSPQKLQQRQISVNQNEEEIIINSIKAFEKLIEFIQNNKQDKKRINEKIDTHKKFIWSDIIAKKNQIEQLFKEMVDFDSIIDVLDIGDQDKEEIKSKYRRYFNFTINNIQRILEDISSL